MKDGKLRREEQGVKVWELGMDVKEEEEEEEEDRRKLLHRYHLRPM